MVNEVILNYLEKYKKEYSLDKLKKEILSKGYSENDFDEAVSVMNSFENIDSNEKISRSSSGNLLLKVSGIIGFLFFILGFLSVSLIFPKVYSYFSSTFGNIFFFLIGFLFLYVFLLLFYYSGFFKLGSLTDSKFLKVSSVLNILFILIFVSLSSFLITQSLISSFGSLSSPDFSANSFDFSIVKDSYPSIFYFLVISLFLFVLLKILIIISLITIRKQVRFSFSSAILNILFILFVGGVFVYYFLFSYAEIEIAYLRFFSVLGFLASYSIKSLFESLVFFNASKSL